MRFTKFSTYNRIPNILLVSLKIGVVALLVVTPFLFYSNNPYPYGGPKVAFFQSVVEVLFAFWLFLVIFFKRYRPVATPLTISLVLLLLLSFLSAYLGVDWHKSFWDVIDRQMGLVAILHFFVFFLILSSLWREFSFRFLTRIVSWTGIAVSIIALLQRFHIPIVSFIPLWSDVSRLSGTFSNAPFFAGYLLFVIFFSLWLAYSEPRKVHRIIFGIGSLLGVITLFFTQTRGTLIGFLFGIVILFFCFLRYDTRLPSRKKVIMRSVSIVILLFIVFSTVLFWFSRTNPFWRNIPGMNRFASQSTEKNFKYRFIVWKTALKGVTERPLLGWGWNNYDVVYNKFFNQAQYPELPFIFSGAGNKPFNVLVEYLVSGGILGLLSYLLVFLALLYELWRGKGNYRPFF